MGLTRSRTITLAVAVATLTSNVLSSILVSQLPNDPYNLATNFSWYLHFANILSVFGFIGALRQHALSIALFANYLIFDSLLCAVPRFLLLTALHEASSNLCTPTPSAFPTSQSQLSTSIPLPSLSRPETSIRDFSLGDSWSQESCNRILGLVRLTTAAGLVAATLLKLVGALAVRGYAKALWLQEVREEILAIGVLERRSFCEERGLPVILEEEEIVDEKC